MSKPFRESLEKQLKDPNFKKEWDALEPEFKEIRAKTRDTITKELDASRTEAGYKDFDEVIDELETKYGI